MRLASVRDHIRAKIRRAGYVMRTRGSVAWQVSRQISPLPRFENYNSNCTKKKRVRNKTRTAKASASVVLTSLHKLILPGHVKAWLF